MRFDELLMSEKEKSHTLKLEIASLKDQTVKLKYELQSALLKGQDLEKENFNLQNELDKEVIK